jgi:hypothetical protein
VSTREPPIPEDPLADAAALIRDVGRSAQQARRYRALAAAVADPIFDRALAIGSDVRRAMRSEASQALPAVTTAVDELRALLTRCGAAIAEVKRSPTYEEAAAAFAAGAAERVAALAAALFTDVTSDLPKGTYYWAVPVTSGRSGAHFLPAGDLATRLHRMATDGLAADSHPPELGGDETIRPLYLTDRPDETESPIALAFEPDALPTAIGRLAGTNAVLVYTARLRADFTVTCAASVDDEWWNVTPDAYRDYLQEFRDTLSPYGLRVIVER